tara:strand:+ start:1445 stop:2044 length:600 start_codon:yes stop_codon:yes gene_type:complete
MEIFVIRHTEVYNPENLCYGNFDIPLMRNYKNKSKKFFDNLPKDLDKIYTSPSKRCTDLIKSMNLKFSEITELRELDFGDWEGKKWDEINQIDLNIWMHDFINNSPKNGEKMIDLYYRVIQFTESIIDLNFSKILFVTHAGVIRALLSNALNISLKDTFNIQINHNEIYRFKINQQNKFKLLFLKMLNLETMKVQDKLI